MSSRAARAAADHEDRHRSVIVRFFNPWKEVRRDRPNRPHPLTDSCARVCLGMQQVTARVWAAFRVRQAFLTGLHEERLQELRVSEAAQVSHRLRRYVCVRACVCACVRARVRRLLTRRPCREARLAGPSNCRPDRTRSSRWSS